MTDERMRVAIVHYHLRPGGVTRVIENAVASLKERVAAVAISGPNGPTFERKRFPCPIVELPALAYEEGAPACSPDELAIQLREAATHALGGAPDVWHIHNHSLGKNATLTAAVHRLAQRGERLLLQIHDFAEDGRPSNYRFLTERLSHSNPGGFSEQLYPDAAHIHYAALNARDLNILATAGAPTQRLHALANPVALDDSEVDVIASDQRFFLYPTRAIRRKNIGELLLWAAASRPGDRFGVTLAPNNPTAKPIYDRWVQFAQELNLPVEFEVGAKSPLPFPALMRSAHALMTTSVAEGFGLAFLEPWLAGRPLLGRNLADITSDFVQEGVNLSGMYERVEVPLDWVGERDFRRTLDRGLKTAWSDYGRVPAPGDQEQAFAASVTGGRVEFGRLPEAMQETVIERIAKSQQAKSEISPASLDAAIADARVVQDNRRRIQDAYNLRQYGDRLFSIYHSIAQSEPAPLASLDAGALLNAFMSPQRFCLLRT
ncbi:MAG: glycosyltransferase family 4 protein [Candidatus Hinthialibacter antarcticus]|nr:glycosyltransferase family 4 protein [Candidatus Hinthialibacter antarcticus]